MLEHPPLPTEEERNDAVSLALKPEIQAVNANYPYWDKVKYIKTQEGISNKSLWFALKFIRQINRTDVHFGKYRFSFTMTDEMFELLHYFDMNIGGNLAGEYLIPAENKNTYLISSIMEEAIASSQMEGAATTRREAKEMLRKSSKPKNKGLCSMKVCGDDGNARYILPQGAPTSPILTNMVCDKLDRRLAGLAKRFGLHYSRYADDITFSSMHNVYQKDGEFRMELKRIIESQGFTINTEKTRLQKIGSRQEVTGIIVSNKLNVTQKYVRDIRNLLYIWDRYGFGTAYNKFFYKYKEDKGHVKKGNPDLVNVIDGKLNYLKMVKGEDDTTFLRLKHKFDLLVNNNHDNAFSNYHGDSAIDTMTVLENEKENRKEIVSISHCRDEKGDMFRIINRTDKAIAPTSPSVDIDDLNNDLDALLD